MDNEFCAVEDFRPALPKMTQLEKIKMRQGLYRLIALCLALIIVAIVGAII